MSKKLDELKDFKRLVREGVVYNDELGMCLRKNKPIGFVNNKTGRYIIQSPYSTKYNRYVQLDRFIYWLNWGKIPEVINHINGDKSDCHLENLRELVKVDGVVVVGEKPNQNEIDLHNQEITKLRENPNLYYKQLVWYKDWRQSLIEKGEWRDKEDHYLETHKKSTFL